MRRRLHLHRKANLFTQVVGLNGIKLIISILCVFLLIGIGSRFLDNFQDEDKSTENTLESLQAYIIAFRGELTENGRKQIRIPVRFSEDSHVEASADGDSLCINEHDFGLKNCIAKYPNTNYKTKLLKPYKEVRASQLTMQRKNDQYYVDIQFG